MCDKDTKLAYAKEKVLSSNNLFIVYSLFCFRTYGFFSTHI